MSLLRLSQSAKILQIVLLFVFGLIVVTIFAQLGGENGTKAYPYQIESVALLNKTGTPYLFFLFFVQTCGIDLIAIANWQPINTAISKFTGNYATISNLTISLPNTANVSLFGYAERSILGDI